MLQCSYAPWVLGQAVGWGLLVQKMVCMGTPCGKDTDTGAPSETKAALSILLGKEAGDWNGAGMTAPFGK